MDRLLAYLEDPDHSQVELARLIGVSQPAIARWIERGRVPAERVLTVSRITGIPASELRPDIYPVEAA